MTKLNFFISLATALFIVACTNPPADNAATTDDGSAATTAAFNSFFNDVINGHNPAKLDEIIHPDFHSHHYPMPPGSDRAGFI